MKEQEREITWETFRSHVPVSSVQDVFPMYSYRGEHYNPWGELTIGFHIKDDWGVTFHKSKYRGKKCYFITHSAIEYIWTEVT